MQNRVLAVGLLLLIPSLARANGLEAPVGVAARYAAIGGASASSADRADAVLLNPAGLGRAQGLQVVLSASPVFARSHAPLTAPEAQDLSKASVAPLAELALSYELLEGLAIGGAFTVAGGLGADYGAVKLGPFAVEPEVSQLLGSFELSLGAGWRLTRNLSVGAAWRGSYQRGEIRSASPGPMGTLAVLKVDGASGTNLTGFRLGAQLETDDRRYGAGVMVRTPVVWRLVGQGTMSLADTNAASPEMPLGEVETRSVFPLQVALGVHAEPVSGARIYGQYSFSDYSVNDVQSLSMAGMVTELRLDWRDRHTFQVGLEYAVLPSWKLRGGYVYETQVVPSDRPSIYAPPAGQHSATFGTGLDIWDGLGVEAAFIYSRGAARGEPAADAPGFAGEYLNQQLVGALSVAYRN